MKRRSFLKTALASSATAPFLLNGVEARATSPLQFLAQLPTAAEDDRILIICQLFGGNDGLNTAPPVDDPKYYEIRPNIAVPKKDCWNGIPNVYLHPALTWGDKGGIASMLQQGSLAVVRNIGYPNPNLSHFRSTDIWLSGINDSNVQSRLDTGWVGRYLSQKYPTFPANLPDDPLAIQFGGFSLALESKVGRMGIEVSDPSKQQGVISANDALDDQSAGTAYYDEYQFVADIAARSDKYAQRVKTAYASGKALLKAKYQNDSFGKQMANTAALIAGGLKTKVYVVSLGGFDTHVTQTYDSTNGAHPSLLYSFSDAVAQFMYDMVKLNMADKIIGISVSEFGRRPDENGSFGTDHGTASVQFVFGTQVNSGIFGTQFDLTNRDESNDLVYSVDFRSVYMDILMKWFGMTIEDARVVLKDDTLTPISVIQAQHDAVQQPRMSKTDFSITSIYPNPFRDQTTIVLELPDTETVSLEVTNLAGERVAEVFMQTLAAGVHQIPISLAVASGSYIVCARTSKLIVTKAIHCIR